MLTGFENIKSAVSDVRFDARKNTCDIITAVHAEGEARRNLIQQNELQALRDKVSDLQLAQSQCAQNAYLINQLRPCVVPAYLTWYLCKLQRLFEHLNNRCINGNALSARYNGRRGKR